MDDFLLDQPSPGSDAAIVIGRWAEAMTLPGEIRRGVFWIVDADGNIPTPPGALTVQPVEVLDVGHFEASLDEFLHRTPKALPALYVTRFIPDEHAARYVAAIDAVAAALESHRRARVTRQQDAFAWQSHLLENIADYVARRLPGEWEGALAGTPAFICGAGPSLDASIGALAREARHAVVFAADSSLRALARCGVAADFAVSVDVAKTPARCLSDDLAPARVILAATSPPAWSAAVPEHRRFYLSSSQLTLDWLDSLGVTRTPIAVHENCGSTALELARFLGCAPIYLFGLDLALSDTGPVQRHHDAADPTMYTGSNYDAAQEFPRVPGNFAATVPTHVIGDWRALDRRLTGWPAGLVKVVTDRGARLNNTEVVRPEDFALSTPEEIPKKSRLEKLFTPTPAPVVASVVADELARFGAELIASAPRLRASLQSGGVVAVVERLRAFLSAPEHGRMLGAYALKLLPDLLPPLEADTAHWTPIIGELEALGRHAVTAAARLRNQG